MRMLQDGVEVMILPDNAYCAVDNEHRSPLDIDDCPCGYETCNGGCWHYHEDDYKREGGAE